MVTIAVIWFALIVFLPEQYVPFPTSLALEIRSKGAMVFGVERHFFFTSIQELAPISFPDLVARIGGFKVSGVIILISAAGAFFAHPKFRMPLVLGLCFLFAGLSSQRLIHIGCFSLAISVALLPKTLDFISDKFVKFTSKLKIAVPPPPVFGRISDTFSLSTFWAKVPRLSILAVPAIIVVILSCAWWTGHHSFPLRWNKLHDELFSPFRESGIKGASFCNWWDDGYFIMARSGQSAFFDGGSQNPDTTYAAARPWLMLDRVAAARWMRFFSRRGLNGLEPLEKIWGKEQAYAVLERFFLALEPNGSLRPGATYSGNLEADLARLPGGHTWLFPEGRVFVFFPKDIFGISAWWIAMGNSRPADSNLVRMHFSEISRNEFQHNKETGNVTLAQSVINRGQTSIGSAIDAAVTPISGPPWTVLNLPGPYIVYNSAYSTTFIVDQFGLVSLPLYLLLPGGPELPNFKLVKVNYQAGGIWEVLP
ncbi:MAG: hypothetical protein LBP22_02435 [Deltaproteobacteria bacterium]|nr:hypothetical protein [Deltaproteobacteria bacterium]